MLESQLVTHLAAWGGIWFISPQAALNSRIVYQPAWVGVLLSDPIFLLTHQERHQSPRSHHPLGKPTLTFSSSFHPAQPHLLGLFENLPLPYLPPFLK